MHWRFKLKQTCAVGKIVYNAITVDKATFRRLEEKRITPERALKLFKETNLIDDDIPIDEFITWVRSLGYKVKGEPDERKKS